MLRDETNGSGPKEGWVGPWENMLISDRYYCDQGEERNIEG
jgi:hypothetical protein